jgi:CcmD family protein
MTNLQATTTAPADRSTGFEPVQGGTDTVSAQGLLVAAYLIMWALLLLFLLLGWRRQQQLSRRISDLEKALDRAEGASSPNAS